MNPSTFSFYQTNFNVENNCETNKLDKIGEIRYYIEYLNSKWREHYYPSRDLCIDESVIPYRGACDFTVELRNKPNGRGFLVYGIADSENGFYLKTDFYLGNKITNKNHTKFSRINRLLEDYLDKGHIVYLDNFFTSVELSNYLQSRNTGLVGTLKNNRTRQKNLDENMEKNEVRYYEHKDNKNLLLTIFYDTIIVKALSNCVELKNVVYEKSYLPYREIKMSPLVFREYNKKARAIDLANQISNMYKNKHTCKKWWHSIFNYFLTLSVNNAYLIYKTYNLKRLKKPTVKSTNGEVMTRKNFFLFIVRKLLWSNGIPNIKDIDTYFENYSLRGRSRKVLKLRHVPSLFKKSTKPRKKCVHICMQCKINKTHYRCRDCANGERNFYMCIQCFEIYHKNKFIEEHIESPYFNIKL